MLHSVWIWLLATAFFGAGLFNVIGSAATQDGYVRWGYPRCWCRVTGVLEMTIAILIALPATRGAGLILSAAVIAAAAFTVLRHRDFGHLVPLGIFAALLVFTQVAA